MSDIVGKMEKTKFIEAINKYGAEKVNGRVRWSKNSKVRNALLKAVENDGKVYCWQRKIIRCQTFETDFTSELRMFLIASGINYSSGNDAPRGGKLGEFIQVKLK